MLKFFSSMLCTSSIHPFSLAHYMRTSLTIGNLMTINDNGIVGHGLSVSCVCEVALILACLSLRSLLSYWSGLGFGDYHDRPASHVPYPSPLRPSHPIGGDKGDIHSERITFRLPGDTYLSSCPNNTVPFPLLRLGEARPRPRELESEFNEVVKEKVPGDWRVVSWVPRPWIDNLVSEVPSRNQYTTYLV